MANWDDEQSSAPPSIHRPPGPDPRSAFPPSELGSSARSLAHIILIRGLADDVTDQEITELTAEFSPTSRVLGRAVKQGFAYVTFQDLRDAQEAVAHLKGVEFHGKPIHASYAYAMPDVSPNVPIAARTVITCLTIKDTTTVSAQEVGAAFSEYGTVKRVTDGERPATFVVEYFDPGDARKAVEGSGSIVIRGERIFVELSEWADPNPMRDPELPYPPPYPPPARRQIGPGANVPLGLQALYPHSSVWPPNPPPPPGRAPRPPATATRRNQERRGG
jgi:RNA recognition motif-containing protein